MLIFVEKVTERILYTLNFIFTDYKISFEITNDPNRFELFDGIKFSYTSNNKGIGLNFEAASLLFEEEICNKKVEASKYKNEFCLTFEEVIDPFASIFYILTQYEEYTKKSRDEHERFLAKHSILKKFGVQYKLVCDRLCRAIHKEIEDYFHQHLKKQVKKSQFLFSVDIDNTFAFKWKSKTRQILAKFRDKIKKNKDLALARNKYENAEILDPYDCYEELKTWKLNGIPIKLFWLLADYGKYDKNISPYNPKHQHFINELNNFFQIGIHPSYTSNSNYFKLEKEIKLLSKIIKKEVVFSRQHFLKLNLPTTYQELIKNNIQHDFTTGFSDDVGFRIGTTRSVNFFDLQNNVTTNLTLHPFTYMDITLKNQLNLSPDQANELIQQLTNEIQEYGGDFIVIWHNESLTNFGPWKTWKNVALHTINLGKNFDAFVEI